MISLTVLSLSVQRLREKETSLVVTVILAWLFAAGTLVLTPGFVERVPLLQAGVALSVRHTIPRNRAIIGKSNGLLLESKKMLIL